MRHLESRIVVAPDGAIASQDRTMQIVLRHHVLCTEYSIPLSRAACSTDVLRLMYVCVCVCLCGGQGMYVHYSRKQGSLYIWVPLRVPQMTKGTLSAIRDPSSTLTK